MKIVHLCLCGPVTDGWSYQDNLLTKYHRKAGHEVTIVTSQWIWGNDGKLAQTDKSRYVNSDDVRVVRLRIKKGTVHSRFKRYIGLDEVLEQEAADILFVHGCQFLDMDRIVCYLKTHRNVKVYVDNHSDRFNSASNFLSKHVLHKILWRYCAWSIEPFASRFYGVVPARVAFLKSMYRLPDEKCELLLMGADDDMVEALGGKDRRRALRQSLGIGEKETVIVTGGKVNHYRPEVLDLLQAVTMLEAPGVRIVFFGHVAEEYQDRFQALCRNPRVINVGWIPSEQSYAYFNIADIAAFPGLHSVMWEQAVGMGIPGLFRKLEGFEHVDCGGNCVLMEDITVEGMKRYMEEALDRDKLQEMKRSAQEVSSRFSYKEIARKAIEQ